MVKLIYPMPYDQWKIDNIQRELRLNNTNCNRCGKLLGDTVVICGNKQEPGTHFLFHPICLPPKDVGIKMKDAMALLATINNVTSNKLTTSNNG